jgi:hypothetical protein
MFEGLATFGHQSRNNAIIKIEEGPSFSSRNNPNQ